VAESYSVVPIGKVRSALTDPADAPRQGRDTGTEATLEIDPAYAEALSGIEENERLLVVCWLHLAGRGRLKVNPRGDPASPARGVFATRSPLRPNPFAIYTVELLEVRGTSLRVRGVDAVDGTPVLDIRPHRPSLDG
jgi:L-fuculose-phosphate aldolase